MKDKSIVLTEVEDVLENLARDNLTDETKEEYTRAVDNMSKLHNISIKERETDLKESQAEFEKEKYIDSLKEKEENRKIEKEKINLEREKIDLEREKIRNQHIERLEENEINRIKAENEQRMLKLNQIKAEQEFKVKKRNDWIIFGLKFVGIATVVGVNAALCLNELKLERIENGLIPKPCKTYDSNIAKQAEILYR